jgi:oxygen-independent coproporphyrinogen-3 oxidase
VRHRKPENFLSALRRNGHAIAEEAPLTAREAADEALVMGLRLAGGIDITALEQRLGVRLTDRSAVERLIGSGHLMFDGNRLSTTAAGRLVLDRILSEIAA